MGVGLEETAVKNPLRHSVARWISIIVHPIAFPLLTLAVVVWTATQSGRTASRWVLIAVALTSVPVAALVGWQVLRGRWTDLDVSVRKQRYALYPFGLACMLLLLSVFILLHAPIVAIRAAASWSFSPRARLSARRCSWWTRRPPGASPASARRWPSAGRG